jgi:hypothetical protein
VNKRTGEAFQVPRGVNPGFDSNPGAAWLDIRDAWDAVTPDLDGPQRAEARGLIEGLRLRRLNSSVASVITTTPAGSPASIRSGTGDAPDVRLGDDIPTETGGTILRSTLTETPPASEEIAFLFDRSLNALASITSGGSIWRVLRGLTAPQTALQVFIDHAKAAAAALARLPADEAAIIYRHAMMLWLERQGVISYHFRMSERARQITVTHADLLADLAPRG